MSHQKTEKPNRSAAAQTARIKIKRNDLHYCKSSFAFLKTFIPKLASRIISQFAENGPPKKLVGGDTVKFCGGAMPINPAKKISHPNSHGFFISIEN